LNGLRERVIRTLELTDSRGYNPSLESLSAILLGGPVDVGSLRQLLCAGGEWEFDGTFAGLPGRLWSSKCADRVRSNGKWSSFAIRIARKFSAEYARICPQVRCIMLAGSAASGGFCDQDDIDLNIVVRDGTKYTSYVSAVMLSLKYSLRYGRHLKGRLVPGIPKVICINVVWEERQVRPFSREDDQLAFELLNSPVLYNRDFHRRMLAANPWVTELFPQLLARADREIFAEIPAAAEDAAEPSPAVEKFSRTTLFALWNIAWGLRVRQPRLRERMRLVERVKSPYGIFDIPRGGTGRRAGCSK
jgi:predicted nucleotidyltransferase